MAKLSREEMFCLLFARNFDCVDRFESPEFPEVTGHIIKSSGQINGHHIAVLIFDGEDHVEIVSCKQFKDSTIAKTTTGLYEMAAEHGLRQQIPF